MAPQGDGEVTLPRTVNPAPQRDAVIAVVMDTLCGHLYLDRNEIDPQLTFSEMGVDSLGAVEIVRDLNQHFGLDLDSVAVYDHPTLDRLADFVDAESARGRALHAAAVRPHSPAVVAEAPEEPQVSQAPGAEAPYLPGAEDADAPGAVAEAPSAAARSVAGDAAFSQAVPPKTPVGRSSDGPSPDRPTGPAHPPPLLIRAAGPTGSQDDAQAPVGPRPVTLAPIHPLAAPASAPALAALASAPAAPAVLAVPAETAA
ncbi:phosphopantetheine-binding protein, partial [Streptomyces sp. SID3212]|uniref:acyl carrier protein n=1 Tax=Streptomyces sp. SID3212 TaxID=2690259 RepID=UPI0031F6B222